MRSNPAGSHTIFLFTGYFGGEGVNVVSECVNTHSSLTNTLLLVSIPTLVLEVVRLRWTCRMSATTLYFKAPTHVLS